MFDLILTILLLLAWAVSFTMLALYNLHIFQLNSYKPHEQRAWFKKNFLPAFIGRNLGVLLTPWFILFCGKVGMVLSILLFALTAYLGRPRKAKKPLVYTARVKRMLVSFGLLALLTAVLALLIPTVTAGPLRIPLGLGIVLPAAHFAAGYYILAANFVNRPVEKRINDWYIHDAERMLKEMPALKVVGITGSYGKTSVKFFLRKLLSAKFNVLMTPESYNTTMGVVKTVRTSLRPTHEIFLCEMGARNVGDIKEICDIVHPGFGVLTSIGPQHLESFKSIDNVIKTKFELRDALPADGTVFLNWDNEYIRSQDPARPAVKYGTLREDADYFARDIRVSAEGSSFTITRDGVDYRFTTRLIGAHNVLNITGAIAAANTLGVPMADLIPQVRQLESVPHRLQLIRGGSSLIIDDAYNSNPSGAKAALDTLAQFDGVKILVTPGMVELGARQEELNRAFGRQAAAVCDYAVLVGERQAVPIKAGLLDEGYPENRIFVEHDLTAALKTVENIRAGDKQKVVLLENDLPDNY